ncbi:hypothetical protein F5Y04DRAFT_266855 [Hypomontagnella monticulosa]|nr:hypothetical protein F5Y04DRAFT_266855 [Hypomontagnella monticulosa]
MPTTDDFEPPPAYTSHEALRWNSPAIPIPSSTPENASPDGRRHSRLSRTHAESYDTQVNLLTGYSLDPGKRGGYEPPEAMNTAVRGDQEDGCCFSSTGGCCFSSHGGCCFSDNGGCCFSNNGGCCFSNPRN